MRRIKGRDQVRRTGKVYLFLMVGFLVMVMMTQLVVLHNKSRAYAQREVQLEAELRAQQDRQQELADYEQYTRSEEYMRNMAKSKLGLVSPNEIIFRER